MGLADLRYLLIRWVTCTNVLQVMFNGSAGFPTGPVGAQNRKGKWKVRKKK